MWKKAEKVSQGIHLPRGQTASNGAAGLRPRTRPLPQKLLQPPPKTATQPAPLHSWSASAPSTLPRLARCRLRGGLRATYPTVSEVGDVKGVVYSQNARGGGPIFPGRLPAGRHIRTTLTTSTQALSPASRADLDLKTDRSWMGAFLFPIREQSHEPARR